MPMTLVALCIAHMTGTYTCATDAQAAKPRDDMQQQEAKLDKELLEQQGKDKVDVDDDSELVISIAVVHGPCYTALASWQCMWA